MSYLVTVSIQINMLIRKKSQCVYRKTFFEHVLLDKKKKKLEFLSGPPGIPDINAQAYQTLADFDFPGVIFVICPDPMRKYFVLRDRFSEKF